MRYNEFQKLFSEDRTDRYLVAVGNDKKRAQKLYKANMKLCQSLHPLFSVLEVMLRNGINEVLTEHFGNDKNWIIKQKRGFMVAPGLAYTKRKKGTKVTNRLMKQEVEIAEERLKKAGLPITASRIIDEQTLGFWAYFFSFNYYKVLQEKPMKVFKNLPPEIGQRRISKELYKIMAYRNRVNHNGSMCFKGNSIDVSDAVAAHSAVINFISWINPNAVKFIGSLDKVNKAIKDVQSV